MKKQPIDYEKKEWLKEPPLRDKIITWAAFAIAAGMFGLAIACFVLC